MKLVRFIILQSHQKIMMRKKIRLYQQQNIQNITHITAATMTGINEVLRLYLLIKT